MDIGFAALLHNILMQGCSLFSLPIRVRVIREMLIRGMLMRDTLVRGMPNRDKQNRQTLIIDTQIRRTEQRQVDQKESSQFGAPLSQTTRLHVGVIQGPSGAHEPVNQIEPH